MIVARFIISYPGTHIDLHALVAGTHLVANGSALLSYCSLDLTTTARHNIHSQYITPSPSHIIITPSA